VNHQMMSPARFRVVFFAFVIAILLASGLTPVSAAPPQAQSAQQSGPRIWLSPTHPVPAKHETASASVVTAHNSAANGVALAAGDFDGDGIPDLVMGFRNRSGGLLVVRRGNLDAFAPQSLESLHAIGRGDFPAPFKAASTSLTLPVSPDFIATGDFNGNGHLDVAIAARGGSAIYVLAGDGKGKLDAPKQISLTGTVTSMAAGAIGPMHTSTLLVGLSDPNKGISLDLYAKTEQGLAKQGSFPLSAAASNIVFGDFGDAGPDAAFLSGGDAMILHSNSMQLEPLSLPVSATAIALGSFIYDRNPHIQIALLTSDGSLHIAAHSEFNPHALSVEEMRTIRQASRRGESHPLIPQRSVAANGWTIVESIPGAASFSSGQPPVLFRTRITDHGSDDVMILSSGQMTVISHPDPAPDAASFTPAQILSRPYDGSPVAALPMRTNIDGRPGVVALHSGSMTPMVMMPLPDPTFFPNRFDDPVPTSPIATACKNTSNTDTSSSCSLREAVLRANSTGGTDTIQLAAGTYTLTLPKVANDFTGNHGALYVNDSVNIVGAGQNSTIIQAGTSNATGVDMVMAVNEDINPLTNATASISNLTLKFGHNRGAHGNDGDGGCMEFDTGTSGNANLTLTSVTLDSCSTTQGNGGGIAIFNFTNPGNGLVTFTNSIVQNNSASDNVSPTVAATAGGIWVSQDARMSMTNSQVLNNNATQVSGDNSVAGEGGGITLTNNTPNSRQTVIHGSTISGNHSGGNGGGIHNESNLLIDQSSIISNNSAGEANRPNAKDGGGIWTNTASNGCPGACTDVTTLNKIAITGNTTTGNGGGIAIGNGTGAGNVTMTFSRLAANTAPVGKNLSNNSATVSATDDWWGTNTPTNTISTVGTGVTTFDPFIELTHTASPSTIRINQSTTLTGSLAQDNHGTAIAAANLTEVIGLPITFDNPVLGTIPEAQPETLNANAQATATFNAGNTGGLGHADATVDQATVTADIVILEPLRITKSFGAATIPVNGTTTLSFAVNNPNVVAVDASFTDTFPAGLQVASTPGVTNTCGGTVTAGAGSGSVSFSNAALPAGACTITVNVTGVTDGTFNNSVTINSTAAGTGAQSTSSASITVINPPQITKAFGAASIPLNGTTSLSFTITSSNQNLTLNGVAFTDNLPAGLVVATPSNLNNTCGGTATAAAGSSTVSLSGASLAPGASCTVSVNVQGTTAGIKNNSVTVSSTNGGTGNTSNASISVVGPPTISKAFGAASIPLNGSTSLSFTIQNPNAAALTGVGFSDTLPAGLVVSTPNGITGTCGGGTITATQNTNVISLTGATLAANSSCTFSVNVTGTAAGLQNNTTSAVTSNEGGSGGTASASLKVEAPPSIAKVFNPSSIRVNGTTSLTFTITNPAANVDPLTGVAFTDTLPTGLTVASATATVCGGTLTTTAPTGIALSGATIAVNSQCQFSVTVTGAASGQYTNTTGSVTSTNGGTGNTASANLSVASPVTIQKAFGAASIPLNGVTTLTITIQNPNAGAAATGLAFTDNFPAGLVVAPTPNLNNTCGGTATATAGASSVSLTGGSIPASGSCTVSLNVQGTTTGTKNNSVTATSDAGTSNTATASINVAASPVISKAFGAASIPLNGSTSLSFTIQNPNTTTAFTGVGFTDTLPAGLVVSTPNGLTGSCGGGTITATAGSSVISLSGATVAANTSCTFSVNVTGTTAGLKNNVTGAVTSNEGGTGGTASASINVVAPPVIAKVFNPSSISVNGTTSLTFTITNPAANTVALTGVSFTDNLPAGLAVASASATVCGGTLTTTAPSGIALSGATIAANSQCQFSVTVTGLASGQYTNTTGNVTSTNGGTGNTASANLTVGVAAPTITKTFGFATIPLHGFTPLTFTIHNPATSAITGIAFTDPLPSGLRVAPLPLLHNTCGGTVSAAPGSSTITLSGGTLAANATCTISLVVRAVAVGVQNNTTGPISSTQSGAGATSNTATVTVLGPPVISKAFGAASIRVNHTTTLSFTISNPNSTADLKGVAFGDFLPSGLKVANPSGLTGSCGGGKITAYSGSSAITLLGGTLAPSASCTFSVNVVARSTGHKVNVTTPVIAINGGIGNHATASIYVTK
jgi:uncharacterized repeat protein (TIGR01451 family)